MKKQLLIKSLSIVALVWASSLASAQYSFVNVADTTMHIAPDGGTFTDLFPPPSFSGGSVAFLGRFGTTGAAIVTDSGGPLRIIAYTGGPGPFGTWSTPLNFNSPPVISGGQVVFIGNGPSGQGVLVDDGGTLTIAASTDLSGPVGTWTSFGFGPAAISDGTAAFIGGGSLGSGGVFTENGGVFTTIARIGGVTPFGGMFNFFGGGGVAISGSTVAFIGGYTTGTGLGIFTGSGGPLTPIVQRGYLGPVQVGTFLSFTPPAISGSTVAFGVMGSAGQGIVRGSGGPLTGIAWTGEVTPFGTFSSFIGGGVSISGSTVAFSGRYNSDADRGIFIWSGGALTKVIASGDPLFDSVATDVNIGFSALDPDGSIAFYYTLENGRKGVAIASPMAPNLPPIAVATIAEDIDLDEGDATVLVMSLNGVDAAVTLDGTASYDPDVPPDLPLSYDWFVDGSVSPSGSGGTFPTSLSVGPHTVALRVIDSRGLAGLIAIVDVEVITFAETISSLQDKVNSSEGFLWRPVIQKRLLNSKLGDALTAFESGNLLGPDGVCDELADFQNLIGQWTRTNPPRIDSALAAELTAMAEEIRVSTGCP